jgi:GWxTD domain-containing protein
MKRLGAVFAAFLLVSTASAAQSLPELFQKAKAQIKGDSWTEALKTLDKLDADAALPGNEAARQQLAAPTAFYRGVCEANLGQADKAKADFATFLQLQPNASMDPSMYSKKAIAAFEAARASVAPPAEPSTGGPSMFARFQEFRLPANSGEPVNDHWGDGPIRWILTSEEKRTWMQLTSGGERQEFVDKFWETRNPQPGNPDNTYRTAFERRVAFADANFVQAEGTRGSMTDRGMVFVLLGPPTYVGRKPIRTGDDASEAEGLSTVGSSDQRNAMTAAVASAPSGKISSAQAAAISDKFSGPGTQAIESSPNWREIWHYRKELLPKGVGYQQVDVDFITKKGYGVNIMQRDTPTLNTLAAAATPPAKPNP